MNDKVYEQSKRLEKQYVLYENRRFLIEYNIEQCLNFNNVEISVPTIDEFKCLRRVMDNEIAKKNKEK